MKISDHILKLPNDPTPWRLFIPDNAQTGWAVLWLQGHTSTIDGHSESCARMSERQKVAYAVIDYAGHGTHPTPLGDSVRSQQLKEVIGAYDKLQELGYKNIIVSGGSFGAYMAALLTGSRKPEAVIVRAPANYPDEEFDLAYKVARSDDHSHNALENWRKSLSENFRNMPLNHLASYPGLLYVFEHENDEVIPRNLPLSYFHAAQKPSYILLKDSVHSIKNNTDPKPIIENLEQWLAQIVEQTVRRKETAK